MKKPASPLPWSMDYDERPNSDWRNIHIWQADSKGEVRIAFMSISDATEANAKYLVTACNDYPKQQATIQELKEALERVGAQAYDAGLVPEDARSMNKALFKIEHIASKALTKLKGES